MTAAFPDGGALDAAIGELVYREDAVDLDAAGPVEGADPCPQGCEPIRLRPINSSEDECLDCGRTGPRDDFDRED